MRLNRYSYIGERRCFFTICTHRQQRPFVSTETVDPVWSRFLQCAEREQIAITAYCFMPNHLHLLTLGMAPPSDSLRFVNAAKQESGFWYSRRTGQSLWHRYSWDRVLRANDTGINVVRYILMNPVRAGLAADPFAYPFSGSRVYSREALSRLLDRDQRLVPSEVTADPRRQQM
jgi:putative transposase